MPEDKIEFIKHRLEQPIVIIGMMGAGKTTLARKLSETLGWDFIDSDLEIEKEQKISIREIFETQGEASFRALEKSKISQLLQESRCVLSVGGGAITAEETAQNIFAHSLSCWVDAPVKVLAQRISGQGSRPLLNGRDAEEALTERMEQRKHLYSRARLHIDGAQDIDVVAENAIGQIYQYLIEKTDEI